MTSARTIKRTNDWSIPGQSLHLAATSQKMDAIGARFPGARHHWYILKGRKPVPVSYERMNRWAREQNNSGRFTVQLARESAGHYTVSTVFLGLDHGHSGPPVLFETMAFATESAAFRDEQYRYRTYEEAITGHKQLARRLRMQLVQKS